MPAVARDVLIPAHTRRRAGLDLVTTAAKVVSALAFAAFWFAALVLATAIVVIAMLDA
jgi:hypothetical protein